jgi:Family of unknown function (DUF5677)
LRSGDISVNEEVKITVGCPEFWPEFYKAQPLRLQAIAKLPALANAMFDTGQKITNPSPADLVVRFLTQATVMSMNDVIVLCGNGCGFAALKIVRAMFESSTVAEYIRSDPSEAENFMKFWPVIAWRRYQWMTKYSPERTFTAEFTARIEEQYSGVKDRFSDGKGGVRWQWSGCSIAKMSRKIGREEQYELVYGYLSSMHHLNPEAMMAHIDDLDGVPTLRLDGSPSARWCDEALIGAHTYVLFAMQTFNDHFQSGCEDKIRAAAEEFSKAGVDQQTCERSL